MSGVDFVLRGVWGVIFPSIVPNVYSIRKCKILPHPLYELSAIKLGKHLAHYRWRNYKYRCQLGLWKNDVRIPFGIPEPLVVPRRQLPFQHQRVRHFRPQRQRPPFLCGQQFLWNAKEGIDGIVPGRDYRVVCKLMFFIFFIRMTSCCFNSGWYLNYTTS